MATQRSREIAIRSALGAKPRDVLYIVLAKALSLATLGVIAGAVAAVALTHLLAGLLFGVTPTDPATFAAVAALIIGVALVAGALPAARATRIDAAQTLKM